MILSPETEARLQRIASRRGLSPEQTLDRMLAEVQAGDESAVASDQAQRPVENALSPTMTLFRRWAAEDATDDADEIACRQREGDEMQARLAQGRFSLEERTALQASDPDEPAREAGG